MLRLTCEPANFVHGRDPLFVGAVASPGPAENWYEASGQHGCTVVQVRALTIHEYDAIRELEGAALQAAACEHGLVAIDGLPVTEPLVMGWAVEIANLIIGLSTDPLRAGRPSRSTGGGSMAQSGGVGSPESL